LRGLLRSVEDRCREQMLATSGVRIAVSEEPGSCPLCGGGWRVLKTVPRHCKAVELGEVEIRETVHVCANGCRQGSGALVTRRAVSLAERIMPGRVVGYDVMVRVGLLRFCHHRQREAIREELALEGVHLSAGEVSNLARLFLEYLEALHHDRTAQIRAALKRDGGWPMHVDATGESGRGMLLVVYAGWRQWVLASRKIPTERAEAILPCLREVLQKYGSPCAMMRDLGGPVTKAMNALLAELKREIPVLACHFHFLKDIGKDLQDPAHGKLRALFRSSEIRPRLRGLARDLGVKLGGEIEEGREEVKTWQARDEAGHRIPPGRAGIATVRALAQWILDFQSRSAGQSFPFARPYLDLYDRCLEARRAVDAFLCGDLEDKKVSTALERLQRILDPVACDVPFSPVVRSLRTRAGLFDELRDALRLAPESEGEESAPEKEAAKLRDIREQVEKLTESLEARRPERGPAKDTRKAIDTMLGHILKHGEHLWGHEIELSAEAGGGMRLVDRTNNILEGFFDTMKHDERRRGGRKNLAKDLEDLPAGAPLAYNLRDSEYVEILCGSLDRLPGAFARLDRERRQSLLAGEPQPTHATASAEIRIESASLSREDRKLVRTKEMERRIANAAKSRAPHFPMRRHFSFPATAK
jgi:hypothetical protein